ILVPPASSSFSALGVGFTELAHEYRTLGGAADLAASWAATVEALRGRAERDMFGEGVVVGTCAPSVRVHDEDGGEEHPASDGTSAPSSLGKAKGRVAVDFRLGVPGSGRSEFPRAAKNGAPPAAGGDRPALVGREPKKLPVVQGDALGGKASGPCI